MTNTRKLHNNVFYTLFVAIMLAISCLLTACGGGGSSSAASTFTVTWEVSENASVTVENYATLPETVDDGTELVFTVSTDAGYEVSRVTNGSKRVTARDGKYSVTISADTTITVETAKVVTGIAVTTNPTKLTYFAGDSVDVTGMVVTVSYATGDTATLERGVDGYAVSPSIFEGGETSFKVIYEDFEAVVNLNGQVEYLVTIDPNGGTIAQSWLDGVSSMNLNNYAVSEAGVVTFSYYNNLVAPVDLPTAEQVTRENYSFLGWSAADSITNTTAASVTTTASWQAELVVIESASLVVEENKPYLVVTGTYKLANEVYLYLYEGNDNVSFTGDTYTNTGAAGTEFEVKFDLTRLAYGETEDGGSYEGKWMDIRFNATIGDQEESMELFVGEGSLIEVDLSQKIEADGYAFLFATYSDMLKVYFNKIHYNFSVAFGTATFTVVDEETQEESTKEDDALIITGTAPLYKGNTILLTACAGSAEIDLGSAVIDAETGAFVINVDLSTLPLTTNCYVHVTINDADGNTVYGGTSMNLKIASCSNQADMTKLDAKKGDVTNAIRYEDSEQVAYYAGYQWDGLILYAADEARGYELQAVNLEVVDGVVNFVITGTSYGYSELPFGVQFQHNSNIDGVSWDYIYTETTTDADGVETVARADQTMNAVINEDGTFKLSVPVSTVLEEDFKASGNELWALTTQIAVGNAADTKLGGCYTYVVNNGVKYFIEAYTGWGSQLTTLKLATTEEADGVYSADYVSMPNVTVALVDGVVCYQVSGEFGGYTAEELVFVIDFQHNSNLSSVTDWSDAFADYTQTFTAVADSEAGTYVVNIPVETLLAEGFDLTEGNWTFTVHFGLASAREEGKRPADYKPTNADTTTYVVKDGIKYSIRLDGSTWSIAALVMEPTTEADGTYTAEVVEE